MVKLNERWAEVLVIFFLALGFIISVSLRSAVLSYISMFLAGFVAARSYYFKHQKEPILPFVLMIIGFLVGYLIASFWASRLWVLVFFALGFTVSYYLHQKQILVIFKNENFVK